MKKKTRCAWAQSETMKPYHDKEWGKPVHDDKKLFEFIVLEGAQAGLNWLTILKKRGGYRKAFCDFDPKKIARFTNVKIKKLINDSSIVRNRLKIESTVKNAKEFLKIKKEYGSFDSYIWSFVKNEPIINKWKSLREIPTKTQISDDMSKDLKKRGFKFVGSTICYAFMQAIGMVNDHTIDCYRYKEIVKHSS